MHPRTSLLTLLLIGLALVPLTTNAQDDPPTSIAYEAVDLANGNDLMLARARAIDLAAYPIIPEVKQSMLTIFERGLTLGREPYAVSKVGDCNSAEWLFLYPFGENQYDLGPYYELQNVIDRWGESFTQRTYAAHNGLNVYAALDPMWADPSACQGGETPLDCEYRLHNPSVAIIMFGTNDMLVLEPEQFDYNLRRVVQQTRQAGIIPVLSTFPRHLAYPERSILFNQIVVRIALDFNIPLINLWRALEPLPNHGVDADGFHLNGPITGAGDFASKTNLQTGYPQRNLITLQTLDMLWRNVIQPH